MVTTPENSTKSSSRIAGAALLVAGVSYVALLIILVVVSRGHLPDSGQELLAYLMRYGLLVQVAMAVFIVKDICILLAFPVLAISLGGMQRSSLWVGTVLSSLGMVLDILSSLIVIAFRGSADAYTLAELNARSAYLPIAEFVFRYVWRVETPFIVGLLSIAVFIFSRAMEPGRFGGVVPKLGMILGVVGVLGAIFALIQPVLLLAAWYIAVGLKLLTATSNQRSA
jgi:hypothetical protein